MLRACLALKKAKVLRRALVVAPLRVVYEVWPKEAEAWAGSEWNALRELRMEILHGEKKEYALNRDADLYVINFEGLKWLCSEGYRRLLQLGADTLVVDESGYLKHTRTQRFKLLKPVLGRFARRWILTGSPNPNGYLDLFGQIYIVDLGRALGKYITHYRFNYFTPLDRNGWMWAIKSGADKQIQEAIKPYVMRLDADDYLEMPEIVPNVIRVDLPPAARKVYDELEENMITELEDGRAVTAVSAGALTIKCAQVANGGLFHQPETYEEVVGPRTWANLHTVKIQALEELLEELQGAPVMIAYDFEHDLERLEKALARREDFYRNYAVLGGGVSVKNAKAIIEQWNQDKLGALLVQPKTVAHGLNLQYGSANQIIWHSLTYNLEDYDQLIRRLRRQGSRQKTIFVHHLVARYTVDEAKLRALRAKDRTQAAFLAALKDYARARKQLIT